MLLDIKFMSSLTVAVLGDTSYQLEDDFIISVNEIIYTVPKGFITNFSSVPRIPLIYLVVGNRGNRSAVFHDWLYTAKPRTREIADKLFLLCLIEDGINRFIAYAMYFAVRIAGSKYYGESK